MFSRSRLTWRQGKEEQNNWGGNHVTPPHPPPSNFTFTCLLRLQLQSPFPFYSFPSPLFHTRGAERGGIAAVSQWTLPSTVLGRPGRHNHQQEVSRALPASRHHLPRVILLRTAGGVLWRAVCAAPPALPAATLLPEAPRLRLPASSSGTLQDPAEEQGVPRSTRERNTLPAVLPRLESQG